MADLKFRVHDCGDDCIAAFATPEDAGIYISASGGRYRIKVNNRVVWSEGVEEFPCGESYDRMANLIYERLYLIESRPRF